MIQMLFTRHTCAHVIDIIEFNKDTTFLVFFLRNPKLENYTRT